MIIKSLMTADQTLLRDKQMLSLLCDYIETHDFANPVTLIYVIII